MRLGNRVCLVTGAGQGIGAAIARQFAAEGARLVINDISRETGPATVAEIRRHTSAEAIYIHCDVARADQVQAMIAEAVGRFGRLDVLVNNAAWGHTGGKLAHEVTEEEWDQVLDVCLKGAYLCAKYAIPELIRSGGGSIINIASIAGFFGFPADTAYTVAKGGLLQLNKALAIYYAAYNIRVNAVSPGWTATSANAAQRDDPEVMRVAMRGPLIKRPALPEEIAAAAAFLASDEAAYITGANLVIDGGWSLRSALGGA